MTHGNHCVTVTNYSRMWLINQFCLRLLGDAGQYAYSRLSSRQRRLPEYDNVVPKVGRPDWAERQQEEGLR